MFHVKVSCRSLMMRCWLLWRFVLCSALGLLPPSSVFYPSVSPLSPTSLHLSPYFMLIIALVPPSSSAEDPPPADLQMWPIPEGIIGLGASSCCFQFLVLPTWFCLLQVFSVNWSFWSMFSAAQMVFVWFQIDIREAIMLPVLFVVNLCYTL